MQETAAADDLSGMLGVLNALEDEIVVLDGSGRILAVNDAWERFRVENGGDRRAALSAATT